MILTCRLAIQKLKVRMRERGDCEEWSSHEIFISCNMLTMWMSPLNATSERSSAGDGSEAHSGPGTAKVLLGHLRLRCKLYEGSAMPVRVDQGHSKVF